jgi:hypothetical protein
LELKIRAVLFAGATALAFVTSAGGQTKLHAGQSPLNPVAIAAATNRVTGETWVFIAGVLPDGNVAAILRDHAWMGAIRRD